MTPINADAHRPVARVEQTFTAPPDVVYDALLNASVLFDCFNSSGALGAAQTMVRVTLDARVGGTYDIVDRSARSGEEVSHSGIYLELQLGERIAFSWSVPAYDTHDEQVTIDILPGDAGAGSVVTLAHTMQPQSAGVVAAGAAAWATLLSAIAQHLADTQADTGTNTDPAAIS